MAVDKQKLLPQGNKGGAMILARPKVSLVKKEVKKDITSAPDTTLVIKTRVIEIEKILKGSVALDKKLQDQERKQKEKALRAEEEKELETKEDKDDKKVKKKKSKIKLGFLDGLIKFINDVLMGWLLVRMIDWLPQLKKILPILSGALEFITSGVLGVVNVLGTVLMWGDKAISGSRGFVKNIFGETGAKAFDAIVGTIGTLFNTIAILGMTAAAFGNEWNKDNKPRRKPRSLGDRARRIRRQLQTKAERATRTVRRTFRRLRPTNIRRAFQSRAGRIMKGARNLQQAGSNFLQKFKPSNLRQTGSNLMQRGSNFLQKFKPSNLRQTGSNLMQRGSNLFKRVKGSKAVQGLIEKGKGALAWADDLVKKQLANADNIIGGIKEWGKQQGAKIGKNIKSMNPMKLGEKVKNLLKGQIDDILKKNTLVKQVLDIAKNPKKIGPLLKNAAKNKNVLKLRETLKVAKKAKIGGVDKVIAAIMGVIDYGLLGESPVNAILRALGGLLGYTAGFAIGAPFGGAPGFITGMAGGWVGEQAARLLAKGLVHVPVPGVGKLGMMDDPIAKAIGLSPRKIVRDPDDTAMNDKLAGDQQKLSNQRESGKTDKEIKKSRKTTITIDRSNQPKTQTLLQSGNRSDIEQGLYNLRIDAAKGSGKGISDWVGNKKHAKDADLIMKHGLHNVIIDGGKVTLKESYKASLVPIDVNSVTKDISKSASYEEGGEGGTVVIVENSSGGGEQKTESESTLVVAGGGDSSSMDDAMYKGG